LFRGSVFDNIAHGLMGTQFEKASKEAQMTHVMEAAKIAYADDFISQLPDGYNTDIGQRGSLLSGGQKQRIAIARSLVSNPKVLLLDEATSALDPYAEGIVQKALDGASAGRTTIVIAHKLATIRKADNIVVMSAGRILEQGTHESLIALDGAYSKLVNVQQLTVKEGHAVLESDPERQSVEKKPHGMEESKLLTRYATLDEKSVESTEKHRYDEESSKQLGLLAVIWRLVVENPELKWSYLALVSGCIVSGKLQVALNVSIIELIRLQLACSLVKLFFWPT
jgi:ATP-binding cassette subfamily B (MDR/TAP) protein 1